jgi:hypothetical protein
VSEEVAHALGRLKCVDLPRRVDQSGGAEGEVAEVRTHIDEGHAVGDGGEEKRRDIFFDEAVIQDLAGALLRKDNLHFLLKESVRGNLEGERHAAWQPQERGIEQGCGWLVEEPGPPWGTAKRHGPRQRAFEISHIPSTGGRVLEVH